MQRSSIQSCRYAIIGLNGAGKTTFLKVLSGLLPVFRSERISFSGKPVNTRERGFKMCRSGNDVAGCGSGRDISGTNLWAVAFVGDGNCVIRLSQGDDIE